MKPNKVLCCMFLFALLALTAHKTFISEEQSNK